VDPFAVIPAFIAMTPNDSPAERSRMAKIACLVVAGVLLGFGFAGKWVFQLLGITMPAFQIAASIVLLLVALDMLRAQRSRVQETSEETAAGAEKTDIAVTPLAIPMLSGPGAISTVILLESEATTVWHSLALCGCILLVSLASYGVLHMAAHGAKRLNPIALRIGTRVMGLLLAAIAVQFMVNALKTLMPHFFE
jgi:multiple antibiotic resistance protein